MLLHWLDIFFFKFCYVGFLFYRDIERGVKIRKLIDARTFDLTDSYFYDVKISKNFPKHVHSSKIILKKKMPSPINNSFHVFFNTRHVLRTFLFLNGMTDIYVHTNMLLFQMIKKYIGSKVKLKYLGK